MNRDDERIIQLTELVSQMANNMNALGQRVDDVAGALNVYIQTNTTRMTHDFGVDLGARGVDARCAGLVV